MNLTNVALYSNGSEVARLSFRDPGSVNPYTAKSIDGLDADEIVPSFSGFSLDTGGELRLPSIPKRDVVLRIALNAQWGGGKSYSELRDDLYRAIASSRTGRIQLRFRDGEKVVAAVQGSIVKFEAEHFTETPEVKLTVRCDDPMLRALDAVEVDKTYLGTENTLVSDLSTAPHGLKFNITFTQPSTTFMVRDSVNPTWSFIVEPGLYSGQTGFQTGDELWLSSVAKDRYLYLVRYPAVPIPGLTYEYHLIDKIEPYSSWPLLFPGANDFQFIADGTFTWGSMSYYPTYWGV